MHRRIVRLCHGVQGIRYDSENSKMAQQLSNLRRMEVGSIAVDIGKNPIFKFNSRKLSVDMLPYSVCDRIQFNPFEMHTKALNCTLIALFCIIARIISGLRTGYATTGSAARTRIGKKLFVPVPAPAPSASVENDTMADKQRQQTQKHQPYQKSANKLLHSRYARAQTTNR